MQGAVEKRQLPTSLVMLRNISIEESESITVGASSALNPQALMLVYHGLVSSKAVVKRFIFSGNALPPRSKLVKCTGAGAGMRRNIL